MIYLCERRRLQKLHRPLWIFRQLMYAKLAPVPPKLSGAREIQDLGPAKIRTLSLDPRPTVVGYQRPEPAAVLNSIKAQTQNTGFPRTRQLCITLLVYLGSGWRKQRSLLNCSMFPSRIWNFNMRSLLIYFNIESFPEIYSCFFE